MAIFRGPGGAGNATTDSEITLLTQLEQSSSQSADNAATSATNAATSATQAATSATNASSSASAAATSASNAATSESNAASSANASAQSAQDAANSAASIDPSNFVDLSSAQTITGVKTFSSPIVGSINGNAETATALQTARTIGGVSFDGTANINLPGVNIEGNQNTSGSAASVSGSTTAAVPTEALASGTADSTTFLRGDRTWQSIPAPTIASTAEAQAGTNNTNFITPLRMREGFNAGGSAPVYACRAWVNFDGTTTPPTIRASGNVSSVTRNGTGDYTVNFTTAMPDANYSVSFGGQSVASSGWWRFLGSGAAGVNGFSSSSYRFSTPNVAFSNADTEIATLMFFR